MLVNVKQTLNPTTETAAGRAGALSSRTSVDPRVTPSRGRGRRRVTLPVRRARTWFVDHAPLERARVEKCWTYERVGQEAGGVDRGTVSDMLHGVRRPNLDTLELVCRALGVNPADVIVFTD